MFNPILIKIKDGVLMYQKHIDNTRTCDPGRNCLPAEMLPEVQNICHEGAEGEHRGVEGRPGKFQRSFIVFVKLKMGPYVPACQGVVKH